MARFVRRYRSFKTIRSADLLALADARDGGATARTARRDCRP